MKITQANVIMIMTTPRSISIIIACVIGNENSNSGNTNILKRSFKFLYLILSISFGKGLKYLSTAIQIHMVMNSTMKTMNANPCVLDNDVSTL